MADEGKDACSIIETAGVGPMATRRGCRSRARALELLDGVTTGESSYAAGRAFHVDLPHRPASAGEVHAGAEGVGLDA